MSEAGDEEDADADPDPEAGDGSLPRSRSRSSRSTSRSRPTSSRPCSFLLALLACLLSFSLGWLSSGTSSSAPLSRAGAGTWLDEQVGQKEFPSPYKEDDPALQFPGDETRDVIPKMVHSHVSGCCVSVGLGTSEVG